MPVAAVCPANPGWPECQVCTGQQAEVTTVNTLGSLGTSRSLAQIHTFLYSSQLT